MTVIKLAEFTGKDGKRGVQLKESRNVEGLR